ncbi:cholesterol oxidase substrate-binding domain-containing protein [Nocardioides sp. WS12]|uniref:cholesterol oxidase substrate-binding domain-containing protein n=1 Tax=Nocardioides sp. WS12 TaxID=2486272 RepID=UPI0015FAAEDE|nr:cholesterol oxidase substrate-binding domain-containing protein [Nocardioides sp. WS12]
MSTVSRRALVGGLAWVPVGRLLLGTEAAAAASPCATPTAFPSGITPYRQVFQNWSTVIRVEDAWTCRPTNVEDVIRLANWARSSGWRLRPRGMGHTWSPLVTGEDGCSPPVLLVDTRSLTGVEVDTETRRARVRAGTLLDDLLAALEAKGLGLDGGVPTIGTITVGGALAIGGHGASVPAVGEVRTPGTTYGSLSNLVTELRAVVWDADADSYVLRTFVRSDPEIGALLVNLGRAFVYDVVVQAGANLKMRCQSYVNIPATTLYGATAGPNSFADLLNRTGRVDVVWFTCTEKPWVKTWKITPVKPPLSRAVTKPYNYLFVDNIPPEVAALASQLVAGNPISTPIFGQAMYAVVAAGLLATVSGDLWGSARNVLVWDGANSLPSHDFGLAVLCRRADVQSVVHRYVTKHRAVVDEYAARNEHPVSLTLHIRACGVDVPTDVGAGAQVPTLSAVSPRPDHPEWDTAVWFETLSLPGTTTFPEFCARMETWATAEFPGLRVEWCKEWAFTDAGGFTDADAIAHRIPQSLRAGRSGQDTWDAAVATLQDLDPHGVFTSAFLERVLPPT